MSERKEYSVVGRVEIGTDEYRDLIEERMEAERSRDTYMREGWKKDEEIKRLTNENSKLKTELEKYKGFIKNHCTLNSEDSITLFFSGE